MQKTEMELQKYRVKIKSFVSLVVILIFNFTTGGVFWLGFY